MGGSGSRVALDLELQALGFAQELADLLFVTTDAVHLYQIVALPHRSVRVRLVPRTDKAIGLDLDDVEGGIELRCARVDAQFHTVAMWDVDRELFADLRLMRRRLVGVHWRLVVLEVVTSSALSARSSSSDFTGRPIVFSRRLSATTSPSLQCFSEQHWAPMGEMPETVQQGKTINVQVLSQNGL
eukprot:CAMPEP_0179052320 /NCGR_PEP_ID=MMETSP0796-20121207/21697_1 /TAXON_ID=73915 /ORGANISM="Pyrodinium bahamense, Strain pbaha01" /LENGTH=184 /DNA_ID=CAMNT_0020748883 /DNA_START=141 /DNA_END=693 /DNA_ORIENTATION=-